MKKLYIAMFLSLFIMKGSFAQTCPPRDIPDNLFQDVNGDGIDGDSTKAIFVAVTGNDTYTGTKQKPVKTIEKGIQLAALAGKDVYVSMGTYILTAPLRIVSGVSLYGEFNCTAGWSRSATNTTIISGVQTAVYADSLNLDTHIEGFEIDAASAINAGESSYAVRINSGSAATILRFNTLKPGAGANGTIGNNGTAGASATSGSAGGLGSCDGSTPGAGGVGGTSPCGQNGGAGGVGGSEGANAGANGTSGVGGAAGGVGGAGGNPGSQGGTGVAGSAGANGTNGTVAPSFGTITSAGLYIPSSGGNGIAGTNGNGGGGAGGGGGQGCTLCDNGSGNGGGGGGGGGCAGTVGTGGLSGGCSFGVLVNNAIAVIDRNKIMTGAGGTGAKGGNGGLGGVGGAGAAGGNTCTGEIGAGGYGGAGGNGGAAGSGAGGAGGASVGIYIAGTSTVQADTNYFTLGNGGASGFGGTNAILGNAPAGQTVTSVILHGTTTKIPVITPGICIKDITIPEPWAGPVNAVFTVCLSSPAQQTITVHYTTTNATAIAGSDYTTTTGILTFTTDQIMKQIQVPVLVNHNHSSNIYFTMNLSTPVNATITDGSGSCTILHSPAGINDNPGTPDAYQLMQNTPNPCSSETEISFTLPQAKQVTLQVYSLSGQLMATLVNEKRDAGWQHVKFNTSDLSSGIYLYRLTTDDVVLFKKLSVIK